MIDGLTLLMVTYVAVELVRITGGVHPADPTATREVTR